MKGFFDGFWSALLLVGSWLTRSAMERHDLISGVLEYVMNSTKIWWIMLALGISSYFLTYSVTVDPIFAAIFAMLFAAFSIIMRSLPVVVSLFATIAMWEFNVWMNILLAITTIPDTRDKFAVALAKVFVWACLTYVIADLGLPPRKRKKIKIRKSAPAAQKEFSL